MRQRIPFRYIYYESIRVVDMVAVRRQNLWAKLEMLSAVCKWLPRCLAQRERERAASSMDDSCGGRAAVVTVHRRIPNAFLESDPADFVAPAL